MVSRKEKRRRRRRNLVLGGIGGTAVIGTGVAIARSRSKQKTETELRSKIDDLDRELNSRAKNRASAKAKSEASRPQKQAAAQQAGQSFKNALETKSKKLQKSGKTRSRLDRINRYGNERLGRHNQGVLKKGGAYKIDLQQDLKNLPLSQRKQIANQIRRNQGGRKSTRANYLINSKSKRTGGIKNRRGRGLSRLSSKQRNRLENRLGYDIANQRFRSGTSKSNRGKAAKILKGLGRFKSRQFDRLILFCNTKK